MLWQMLLLALGFVVLIKGADWLVSGAATLARKQGAPELTVGLTIVAFGTSAPELVVNTVAAFQALPDIVLGNVIGSNNFNLLIILGIAGLITPLSVQSSTVWKEIPLSFLAILIFFVLANDYFFAGAPALSRLDGLLLLAMFALFLFYIYQQLKGAPPQALESSHSTFSNLKIWLMITFGFVGLVLGGKLLVDNSLRIATTLGVSQKIIGLTILAAGTSLPELATSVIAALKKNTDIAIGNIIGSNIFNIFLILSASALVRPIAYNRAFNTDLYLLAGGTLFLFTAMFMGKNRKLDRWEAGILLAAYLVYTAYLISKEL